MLLCQRINTISTQLKCHEKLPSCMGPGFLAGYPNLGRAVTWQQSPYFANGGSEFRLHRQIGQGLRLALGIARTSISFGFSRGFGGVLVEATRFEPAVRGGF